MRAALAVALLAGCGVSGNDRLQYAWDKKDVLCSVAVDDITATQPTEEMIAGLELAHAYGSVALFHMHDPGVTFSVDSLEQLLTDADRLGLEYVTYDRFDDVTPHSGIALAFDDNFPDAWFALRDVFRKHGAVVTFFVTRWAKMTDAQHAEIQQLAADGHAIEAHSVNHLHARDYVAQRGLDAYLADEALPSIQVLEDAGFRVTAYAFPFGESSDELDAALLQHVERVRVSPGSCPR